MLEGTTPGSEIIWSTYDQLNTMVGTKYRVAEIQAREDDNNRDGKVDEIYLNARVTTVVLTLTHIPSLQNQSLLQTLTLTLTLFLNQRKHLLHPDLTPYRSSHLNRVRRSIMFASSCSSIITSPTK